MVESHHYHAMEIPNEETVRADFNNSTFENYGITTRFFRENEKYLVETENQQGEMEVFEVAYTFGWEPLQQYLVKFPDGRMQVLPTCWDVEKEEWYHLYRMSELPLTIRSLDRSMQNWIKVRGLSFHKPRKNLMIPPDFLYCTLKSMLPVNHVMVRAENMLKWLANQGWEGLTILG